MYKKITFEDEKLIQTWYGSTTNLILAHPNAEILNIEILEENQ